MESNESQPQQPQPKVPFVRCAHSELVDPKQLKPHPSNPNTHPASQLKTFRSIIEFQGWRRAITISKRSGYVTRGHGALMTALAAGWEQVPVDYQDYGSANEELADLVADNQLQRMSEMDSGKLTELLVHLDSGETFDLQLTALPEKKILKLLEDFNSANPDMMQPGAAQADNVSSTTTPDDGSAPGAAEGIAQQQQSTEPEAASVLIQLFYTPAQRDEMVQISEFFQKELECRGMAETILQVMRSAFKSHTEDPESSSEDAGQ